MILPQPTPTNLKFPEEIKPCSGFHLLGMQVQCQDKDSNDDRGHNLQCHSCCHRGAAAKERAEFPCYWKHTASPHPTLPTWRPSSLSGKGFFIFFPLKACVGKGTNNTCKKLETLAHGCQFLKEDLEIGNLIQLLRKGSHWYKGHSSDNGHIC